MRAHGDVSIKLDPKVPNDGNWLIMSHTNGKVIDGSKDMALWLRFSVNSLPVFTNEVGALHA